MGKNSKRKGKVGELDAARTLRELLPGVAVRRGQQYSGIDGEDVVGIPGVHIEVKRAEACRMREWLEQARRDAGDKVPVVMHRRNFGTWTLTVDVEHLVRLANCVIEAFDHV